METITISLESYKDLMARAERAGKINFSKGALSFSCPYCQQKHDYFSHVQGVGTVKEFVWCDNDGEGCNKQMILTYEVKAQIKLKAYKSPIK